MHEALTETGKSSPKKRTNISYFPPSFLVPLLSLFLRDYGILDHPKLSINI